MKIILASTSPRRIQLLRQAGCKISVVAPNAAEIARPGEKPAALVARLAFEKAASVQRYGLPFAKSARHSSTGGVVVIGADTIVVAPDGRAILGKPRSRAEARAMLARLAGRTHTVFTGYCLLYHDGTSASTTRLVRVVRSRVTMRPLDAAAIRAYVASGEPMDKAGAYAAQGVGMALIERISGSYANVVGLPICQVLLDLEKKFGYRPLGQR